MHSLATAQIGNFHMIVLEKDVLGFDVAMEDTIAMHMFHCLQNLVHVVLYFLWGQLVLSMTEFYLLITYLIVSKRF